MPKVNADWYKLFKVLQAETLLRMMDHEYTKFL